jgi:4-hydroxybenzoate polyprenyltransferase
VAAAAGALAAAAGRALSGRPDPLAAGLAFGGTLAVYGWDRLRDVERDRGTAPAATALAIGLFREGERYGLVVVDGALLSGAAIALAA